MLRASIFCSIVLALCAACPATPPPVEPSPVDRHATPADPVDKDVLVGLLPPELGDWKLARAAAEDHFIRGRRITTAAGTYRDAADDANSDDANTKAVAKHRPIKLALIDGAFEPEAYASFERIWRAPCENPLFAYRHVTVGDAPGILMLARQPLCVQIQLLIAGRFLLQSDSEGLEPEELTRFLESLPLGQIRALGG